MMMEYKVLSQKDKWFSAKFDPEQLEKGLNAYAKQGWQIAAAVTATFRSLAGSREEMIILMERESD